MQLKCISLFIITGIACYTSAQPVIKGIVQSKEKGEALQGVSVIIKSLKTGTVTDSLGNFIVTRLPSASKITLQFSYAGYETKDTTIEAGATANLDIFLSEKSKDLGEVIIVSSSKTNSRIEDLPARVEVLGSEEVREETQIKPGNIVSLLGDIAGIQVQQTNAATGNADLRIEGLQGKYTQVLRDGMPLFGGYSGSFGILQIPPLDLQQIELVKGASSTLYGGGAIAGMINLVSKKPKTGSPEKSFIINRSTLQENNLNTFFSGRNKSVGYTFFAGGTLQAPVDVNRDGFSDVPNVKSVFVHPRFFVYANPKSTLILGYTLNYENRKGGDMQVLNNHKDANHQFFIENKSLRNTADLVWEKKINNNGFFTAKGSTSFFNRDVNTNVFGMKAGQTLWYSEMVYARKSRNHNWVMGINFNGEDFKKGLPDSSLIPDESSNTIGVYAQDDWKFTGKFTLQAGLRYDHHSLYGDFVLPGASLMYKVNHEVTMRLGGGLGYKTPTLFSSEIDEREYHYLAGYKSGVQAERSYGLNYDINYKTKSGDWDLTFNQTFFYTQIDKPLLLDSISNIYSMKYFNAAGPLQTTGFETYIRAKEEEFEIYLGYVYTDARRKYDAMHAHLPLIARHKIASVVSYGFSEHFRAGIELAYTGKQYLDNGASTTPYIIGAAMINYKVKHISFVLNCENIFDFRQNKNNTVAYSPYTNPTFPEIWAPLDGRVINLSMQVKL